MLHLLLHQPLVDPIDLCLQPLVLINKPPQIYFPLIVNLNEFDIFGVEKGLDRFYCFDKMELFSKELVDSVVGSCRVIIVSCVRLVLKGSHSVSEFGVLMAKGDCFVVVAR